MIILYAFSFKIFWTHFPLIRFLFQTTLLFFIIFKSDWWRDKWERQVICLNYLFFPRRIIRSKLSTAFSLISKLNQLNDVNPDLTREWHARHISTNRSLGTNSRSGCRLRLLTLDETTQTAEKYIWLNFIILFFKFELQALAIVQRFRYSNLSTIICCKFY